ncbi:uncharacterized protein BDZ99DRAFT_402526, partial [Mytilinidion resinicola]
IDSNLLSVNSIKVSVLKKGDEIVFYRLLKSANSRRLKVEIRVKPIGNLTDETLEKELLN